MTTYNSVSNGSKRVQLYKCGWLWQTGYYAKTKRKGGRDMREGWEYICFESCLNKIPKAKQVTTKEYNSGTKYPIISQEDKLISGYCDDVSMLFHVDKPVIIFGDHTRVLKYIDFDFVVGADGVKIISPKENLNAKFLLYFLTWYNIPNLGYSRHYKLLKELDIPVPPLSTQQSIVSELDKINELIRLKKEQLKDYDNLAQSIFYEMFGDPVANDKKWDVESLGKVCDVRDGTHDSPQYLQESPYILITSKNIVNGKIDYSNVNYISEEDYIAINKRSQVDDGDIIMAMIGTIGNPIIVKLEERKFCIKNVALIKFFNESLVSNKYIHSLLNNDSYLSFIKSQNKGGTQKFIALGTIRKLPIPIPPLSYQQQFAQRIELIEKQKAEVQRTIKALETLLASRMQYWFD